MFKIKKGDEVVVIAGKSKGKRGSVLRVLPEQERILVAGVNIVKKHVKPNPNKGVEGGIVARESSLHVSNVAIYNPLTKKADRVGFKVTGENKKVRIFKSNGEVIDV
jgi:large subunit ribosomal protein L24